MDPRLMLDKHGYPLGAADLPEGKGMPNVAYTQPKGQSLTGSDYEWEKAMRENLISQYPELGALGLHDVKEANWATKVRGVPITTESGSKEDAALIDPMFDPHLYPFNPHETIKPAIRSEVRNIMDAAEPVDEFMGPWYDNIDLHTDPDAAQAGLDRAQQATEVDLTRLRNNLQGNNLL